MAKKEQVHLTNWNIVTERLVKPRMIISLRGEERHGKTQFALTAPAPIAIFPFDNNSAEVIEKWRKYKQVLVPKMDLDYKDATSKDEWVEKWNKFLAAYWEVVKIPEIRTIVIDSATEVWELLRLARLGKLTQVMPTAYQEVNVEFQAIIKAIYTTDKNLCLIHRLKDQYKGKDRTGERIVSGYGEVGYKVQLNILCWRDLEFRDPDVGTEGFGITINDCTQNETLAGTALLEPDNVWGELGKRVYPGTTDDDWT